MHLKRFKSGNSIYKSKLDTKVEFPIKGLDLTNYVISSSSPNDLLDGETNMIYDLFAISNHYGGLGGGHYTAYAKNDKTE